MQTIHTNQVSVFQGEAFTGPTLWPVNFLESLTGCAALSLRSVGTEEQYQACD